MYPILDCSWTGEKTLQSAIASRETSLRRGYRYNTLLVDVDRKTVLFAGIDTLKRFKALL
ncbi:hypothetical protein ACWIE6_13730 [Paenibacillus taichungensis]